ncbi:MAG TPA: lipid A biosynthesis acyltransferase [Chromatiales bacterium]|nr:lipid A biosynthesis acyltransferase [Chromatiales bacterium]
MAARAEAPRRGGTAGRIAAEAVLAALARLRPAAAWRLADAVAGLAAGRRARVVAERNVALCLPQLDPERRAAVVRASLRHAARAYLEAPGLWRLSPPALARRVAAVEGEAALAGPLAAGRGVLLLVPHLGSWELVGLWCSARWPMTSLYRPQHWAVDRYIRRARERHGARLLPAGTAGVRGLYQSLREGRLVGMLPDHVPRTGGVFAPFFGEPALTTTLPARLLARTGAAAVVGCALRLPGGRYRLRFVPAPPALAATDPAEAAAALNAAIAALIESAPEQYLWTYKRFKARPPGAAPVY